MKKWILLLCLFSTTIYGATTRNIVPPTDGTGSIGTDAAAWSNGVFKYSLKVDGHEVNTNVSISSIDTNAIAAVATNASAIWADSKFYPSNNPNGFLSSGSTGTNLVLAGTIQKFPSATNADYSTYSDTSGTGVYAQSSERADYLGYLAGDYAIRYDPVSSNILVENPSSAVFWITPSNITMNTSRSILLDLGYLYGDVVGNLVGNADTATSATNANISGIASGLVSGVTATNFAMAGTWPSYLGTNVAMGNPINLTNEATDGDMLMFYVSGATTNLASIAKSVVTGALATAVNNNYYTAIAASNTALWASNHTVAHSNQAGTLVHGLGDISTKNVASFAASLIPDGDALNDLGSTTKRWQVLYASSVKCTYLYATNLYQNMNLNAFSLTNGSFVGNGSGLTNIPTSGIAGLGTIATKAIEDYVASTGGVYLWDSTWQLGTLNDGYFKIDKDDDYKITLARPSANNSVYLDDTGLHLTADTGAGGAASYFGNGADLTNIPYTAVSGISSGLVANVTITNPTLTALTMSGNINLGGSSITNGATGQFTRVCINTNDSAYGYLTIGGATTTNTGIRLDGAPLYNSSGYISSPYLEASTALKASLIYGSSAGLFTVRSQSNTKLEQRGQLLAGNQSIYNISNYTTRARTILGSGVSEEGTTNEWFITSGSNATYLGGGGPVIISNVVEITGNGSGLTNLNTFSNIIHTVATWHANTTNVTDATHFQLNMNSAYTNVCNVTNFGIPITAKRIYLNTYLKAADGTYSFGLGSTNNAASGWFWTQSHKAAGTFHYGMLPIQNGGTFYYYTEPATTAAFSIVSFDL